MFNFQFGLSDNVPPGEDGGDKYCAAGKRSANSRYDNRSDTHGDQNMNGH